ncbi:Abi family protein [Tessaracoccus caeni]|uniref:Abi family protein n=1 Tax=Tessaracoccus caeni TaxID=3031239 RepID=UPI0023DA5F1A|nr:Abi family protein [Tessaracoccus caeni]MDF1489713.1 Abi family protein [Tessaracoccus caeni]
MTSLPRPLPGSGKQFKSYQEQVELLESHGMFIDDVEWAITLLRRVSYYRLSGYWYSFRRFRADGNARSNSFVEGASLRDVAAIYDFDCRLRAAAFAALAPIELSIRGLIGHELGKIDPYAHLHVELLGPTARQPRSIDASDEYLHWKRRYESELRSSREDFVEHHRVRYGGRLPVWAAVEVLDWGNLSYLYGFAPNRARDTIAARTGLTAAQLQSWLRCLNIVRNYAAHHGRMFNRTYTFQPRLPARGAYPELAGLSMNRTFGQLTLVQHLLHTLQVGNRRLLPRTLCTYPYVRLLPITHLGTPNDWESHPLWSLDP